MSTKIMRLTPQQEARFPEFVEKWIAIGLNTQPVDREKAERAIRGLYALGHLREPRVIWCPCPMSTGIAAAAFAMTMEAIRLSPPIKTPDSAARGRVGRSSKTAVGTAVGTAVRTAVDTAIGTAVGTAIGTAVRTAVDTAIRTAVGTAIDTAVGTAVRTAVDTAVRTAVGTAIDTAVGTPVKDKWNSVLLGITWARYGGSLWPGFAAWADYFNEVLGVAIDRHYLDSVEHCGYFWMLDSYCFASERPSRIHRDAQGRLHCEDGQSIGFPSGWGLWHWHGVQVPAAVVLDPAGITPKAIQHETNAEVRRVMLERFGQDRFILESGALPIHADETGTLYRIDLDGDEPLVMVCVTNSTPEPDHAQGLIQAPDGTWRKQYWLRVHPELRPMLHGGALGDPQMLTARNAVASTFGQRGADYKLAAQS